MPLLILGIAFAVAGSGAALFSLIGLFQAATSTPAAKTITAPKKKAAKKKAPIKAEPEPDPPAKKYVFGAVPYATTAERLAAEAAGDPDAMRSRDKEIRDLLKVSRAAEVLYDDLKDQEGIGAVVNYAKKTFSGLFGGGWVGMLTAAAEESYNGLMRSIEGNSTHAREAAWRSHEATIKEAVALTTPAHSVTRTTHAGEEYNWTHVIILSPYSGMMGA